ncbi:hypothetical protein D3C76_1624180 [compost metagenome]
MLKVIKRLSDSHHDDMAYPFVLAYPIQMKLNLHNLLRNFTCSQITTLLKQATGAEAAANITAYLSCNADGKSKFMLHQNSLYQISVL